MKIIILLLVLSSFATVKGQDTITRKLEKRPAYIKISSGLNMSKYRDFVTSPLFYKGSVSYFQLSYLKTDNKKENEFGFSYSSGTYFSNFNNHSNQANVITATLHYMLLYKVPRLSTDKWNTKLGGQFNVTGNLRTNQNLSNYATGYEIIPTLFLSAKIERDISRKTVKDIKFLFWKPQLKERQRKLSYQFNFGVFNSNARKDLPYFLNSILSNDIDALGALKFNAFTGIRINSSLNYTVYLKNKNAVQFSYLWDAYRTGNDLKQFEMVHHVLKLSLLFNTNNK